MECNLEPADRTLRMTAGVFLVLAGLLLLILCYLGLFETWWYIVASALALGGIGAVLSAAAGKCMLRKAIGI
jgi:Flp pilus assembly protein TadG